MLAKIIDKELKLVDSNDYNLIKFYGFKEYIDREKPVYDKDTQELIIMFEEKDKHIEIKYEIKNIDINEFKEQKILESKELLAEFLATHPLFSTCKYSSGRYYTCTSEKQQQLTSKLLIAGMYVQLGQPYHLTWNDQGGICENWGMEELTLLSLQIDAYVTPLVKLQQSIEVKIKNANTIKEIRDIEINYKQ